MYSLGEVESLKTQLSEYTQVNTAAQALVEMVDRPEEGTEVTKTLMERLREAPQKVVGYLADNTKLYVAHILGLFNSYQPQANLIPLGEGMVLECSEETFIKFREEAKPIAEKIIQSLEQDEES